MFKVFLPRFSLVFAFVVFSFFIFGQTLTAEDCECTSGTCCDGCFFRPTTYICNSWPEYSCPWGNDCGSDVGKITYSQYCSGASASCDGIITDSGWSVNEYCNNWEICNGSGCICESSCLGQATNISPDGEQKVQLPVTLSWAYIDGANSYRYKVGTIENHTTANSVTVDEAGNCLLKSNTNYDWQIQACCGFNGNDCGPVSTANFKTSLAPQPISPKNNAVNVGVPVNFDWCDVSEAQSYCILAYMEERLIPLPVEKKDGILYSQASFGQEFFTKNTTYQWEVATCLQEDRKKCGLECNEYQEGDDCGDYSKRLAFTTGDVFTLPTPKIISPKSDSGIPIVNFSSYLSWESLGIYGVSSYHYEIKKDGVTVLSSFTSAASVSFSSIWPSLECGEIYTWEVKSCWDINGNNCELSTSEGTFKTTGAQPILLSPAQNSENITIPVTLNWGDIERALSYKYELSTDSTFNNTVAEGVVTNSNASIGYPELKSLTQYFWRAKSCADKNGEFCGNSEERRFTTSEISPPVNPYPENNANLSTSENYLRWEKAPGASFYQYKVDYEGVEKIPPTIVPTNSVLLPIEKLKLGEYTWFVQSCVDEKCEESSGFSGPWNFNLVQPTDYEERGLVPCGRDYDNPDTDWDERDPCQLKHIIYLLNNILDFLLWRLGLIILVLLVVAVGVIYYFSMGAPSTMAKVKSVLMSALKGYGIMLLAWIIVNWILVILGFQIKFFGNWWQINF